MNQKVNMFVICIIITIVSINQVYTYPTDQDEEEFFRIFHGVNETNDYGAPMLTKKEIFSLARVATAKCYRSHKLDLIDRPIFKEIIHARDNNVKAKIATQLVTCKRRSETDGYLFFRKVSQNDKRVFVMVPEESDINADNQITLRVAEIQYLP